MDGLRWHLVRVDDRLVRVLQYWGPDDQCILANDLPDATSPHAGPTATIIDLERYRELKKRPGFE